MTDIKIIGDPNPDRINRKYDPNLAHELNKQTEALIRKEKIKAKLEEKNKVPIPPTTKIDDSPISPIQNHSDFWTIPGVVYRDEIVTVDLFKYLLDGGNRKTQDEWILYSIEAKARGDFYTGDMPLHHASFTKAYKMSDSPIKEEIRKFIKNCMIEHYLATTTTLFYQPKALSLEDVIVHNIDMPDKYEIREYFTLPDEFVRDSYRPSNYEALLGSNNLEEIQNVYYWLTDNDPLLYRVNSILDKIIVAPAWYDSSDYCVKIGCRSNSPWYASLGLRITERDSIPF
ncbi:MAG: hypothetical protein Q7S27_07035 [Nanoarchaeota archaeon]|nr:hypothetical protein [Nanoarchaeota archaeon]